MATFNEVLNDALNDFLLHGYDSAERLAYWQRRIEEAAQATLMPLDVMERNIRDTLGRAYVQEVDKAKLLTRHSGVARFTLEKVRPHLRAELDRRIMASADLIRINRPQAIAKTLQRFSGWATSIPKGGSDAADKGEAKASIRKALKSLPYEERRVAIDQGHKLVSSLSDILATDGGAIAGKWYSHWRQPGYDYREDHKERDGIIFLMRNSWAMKAGFIKREGARYIDDITKPAEEPFCRCRYQWLYTLGDLPESMLTAKGKEALLAARQAR